jgi:hypothetical protein
VNPAEDGRVSLGPAMHVQRHFLDVERLHHGTAGQVTAFLIAVEILSHTRPVSLPTESTWPQSKYLYLEALKMAHRSILGLQCAVAIASTRDAVRIAWHAHEQLLPVLQDGDPSLALLVRELLLMLIEGLEALPSHEATPVESKLKLRFLYYYVHSSAACGDLQSAASHVARVAPLSSTEYPIIPLLQTWLLHKLLPSDAIQALPFFAKTDCVSLLQLEQWAQCVMDAPSGAAPPLPASLRLAPLEMLSWISQDRRNPRRTQEVCIVSIHPARKE